MLTFPKSYINISRGMWRMFPSSSIHRYDHIQCYVIEPNRILEYSLKYCSATTHATFLLITAYNIASPYVTNENCQLTLGSFVQMSPVFSVSKPPNVNYTQFQSDAKSSFVTHIGFSTCLGVESAVGGALVPIATLTTASNPSPSTPVIFGSVVPIANLTTASNSSPSTPVISGSDQNFAQSISTGTNGQSTSSIHSVSTHSPGSYDETVKIANGVTIPVVFLGLVLLGFLVYRRRRNRKTLNAEDPTSQDLGSPQEDSQPYLQQKGELEAEGTQKHELEAQERRYEVGNEGGRYELPVEESDVIIRSRQELRGEEHSRELETPR